MAKLFHQEDCNLSLLDGKTIAIIGYGSQGHAHALNLKDSGCNVIIGLYKGSKSWAKAEAQGLQVFTAAEAAAKADIIMILINDELQAKLYKESIGNITPVVVDGTDARIFIECRRTFVNSLKNLLDRVIEISCSLIFYVVFRCPHHT